jgi:phage shock protein A
MAQSKTQSISQLLRENDKRTLAQMLLNKCADLEQNFKLVQNLEHQSEQLRTIIAALRERVTVLEEDRAELRRQCDKITQDKCNAEDAQRSTQRDLDSVRARLTATREDCEHRTAEYRAAIDAAKTVLTMTESI